GCVLALRETRVRRQAWRALALVGFVTAALIATALPTDAHSISGYLWTNVDTDCATAPCVTRGNQVGAWQSILWADGYLAKSAPPIGPSPSSVGTPNPATGFASEAPPVAASSTSKPRSAAIFFALSTSLAVASVFSIGGKPERAMTSTAVSGTTRRAAAVCRA